MSLDEFIFAPIYFLFDPQKRLYWPYLLSALVVACSVIIYQKSSWKLLIKGWGSDSSKEDLLCLLLNNLLYKLAVVPLFALQITLILWLHTQLDALFSAANSWRLNASTFALLFTFVLFIVGDFSKYWLHRAYHRYAFLWHFHTLHHSATYLTPLTLFRIHPVEMLLNALRHLLVVVIVSTLFLYFFRNDLTLTTLLASNIFVALFNLLGSNLRHSHLYFRFGALENLFISPAQHQIHHSAERAHHDKNFGSVLSIWDRLFNSFLSSRDQQVKRFGLDRLLVSRCFLKQYFSLRSGK